MSQALWTPSPERASATQMAAFIRFVQARYRCGEDLTCGASAHGVADYPSLYRWSVEHPQQFWHSVWDFGGVRGASGAVALDGPKLCRGIGRMAPPDETEGPWWFPEGRLNYAENLLWPLGTRPAASAYPSAWAQAPVPAHEGRQAGAPATTRDSDGTGAVPIADRASPVPTEDLVGPSDPAVIAWNESGRHAWLTWGELRWRVGRLAAYLRDNCGVIPGDRVAAFMPNIPESIIAMLATASLGALWSSSSPDFGVKGVLDRFGQIAPKVLFCADGYQYNGKYVGSLERVRGIIRELPSVERVVVCEYLRHRPGLDGLGEAVYLREILAAQTSAECSALNAESSAGSAQPAEPDSNTALSAQHSALPLFPFNHPLFIMYSSGTTGLPKCMVHGAGGTLLQHKKELLLHTDIRPGERLFYFSTCGWMMWNWQVSALSCGATLVLYDGSPFAPKPDILWDMAEQEGVNVFGTSAKYIALLEKEGVRPRESHSLPALRAVLGTGSPLAPASFDYVYRDVKADVQLASISGGTDIISCFALGSPMAPVYIGELQTRGLGMRVEVFDAAGKALPPGEQGELCCTLPFPSMPVAFWNDPDGSKYRAAYFDHYSASGAGVWRHGDWCELVDHGADAQTEGLVIHGRSDATLNPGGVRIGTAEIYRQVEQMPEVVESLVIGQDWEDDVRIVLFVRLREGLALDDALRARIQRSIRENTSPHHVPKRILQVSDIPRTISGKIVELAVREVIHGREVKNVDALANPSALEEFRAREELRQ
jgi:acetoacetyl-CoA synthetase